MLNQLTGQILDGTGASGVNARGTYTWPVGEGSPFSAYFLAEAGAAVGSLKAKASLNVGYLYSGPLSPVRDAEVRAEASFVDELTFGGRPYDTIGTLRLTTTFHGSSSASAVDAEADSFGNYSLDISSLEEFNNPHDFARYASGPVQSANETVTLEVDFHYGRPVLLHGNLFTRVTLGAADYTAFSGSGLADFANTAAITKIELMGADGQFSDVFEMQSLSGGRYPFQAPVPEPAALALVLGGC